MSAERYYWRNRTGEVVHVEGCPSQGPYPLWWNWANGKTVADIKAEAARVGISFRFCSKCLSSVPASGGKIEPTVSAAPTASNLDGVPHSERTQTVGSNIAEGQQ